MLALTGAVDIVLCRVNHAVSWKLMKPHMQVRATSLWLFCARMVLLHYVQFLSVGVSDSAWEEYIRNHLFCRVGHRTWWQLYVSCTVFTAVCCACIYCLLLLTSVYIHTVHTHCSSAILDPRVGHSMDVLSPFISLLCHSDWLFHGESCPNSSLFTPALLRTHSRLFSLLSVKRKVWSRKRLDKIFTSMKPGIICWLIIPTLAGPALWISLV